MISSMIAKSLLNLENLVLDIYIEYFERGNTESVIEACLALWRLWRSVSIGISENWDQLDIRYVGGKLLPISKTTLDMVQKLNKSNPSEQMQLAVTEMKALVEWFESFPSNDSTRRDEARRQIANGEIISMEELIERI